MWLKLNFTSVINMDCRCEKCCFAQWSMYYRVICPWNLNKSCDMGYFVTYFDKAVVYKCYYLLMVTVCFCKFILKFRKKMTALLITFICLCRHCCLHIVFHVIFSSPEHEVLMVSYCGQWMSVVRRRASCVNIWCLHSRDHICDLILMKLDQNVCFNNI